MRLLSWNMGAWTPQLQASALREAAWQALVDLKPRPNVALLQEATPPPEELGLSADVGGLAQGSRIGSLVWAPGAELLDSQQLEAIGEYGYVATARVAIDDAELGLISFHARTTGAGVVANVEALFERLEDRLADGPFIVAGDFNSCRLAEESWPGYRHLEFWDRVEADYGMFNCMWRLHGEERRTYWKDCQDAGTPFQDDHILASAGLGAGVRSCEVLDYESFRGISDHAPLVAEVEFG